MSINIFIFQSLMMESLEQMSNINLEVMDVEKDLNLINSNVINIDRNKIEAIPRTNQVQIHNLKKVVVNMQTYVYFL